MIEQTKEKLYEMKLGHMVNALEEQLSQPEYQEMSFEKRLSLLVDAQWLGKLNNRITARIRRASLRESGADVESIDYSARRNLNKTEIMNYCSGNWITQGHNLIVTGATGVGKTYVASALGHYFCRREKSVVMTTLHKLSGVLLLQRESPVTLREYGYLAKAELVIIDEWLRDPVTTEVSRELLSFLDTRYGKKSVLLASQLEVSDWHTQFVNPNTGDAILDRVVHNSHRMSLKGDSMRKRLSPLASREEDNISNNGVIR